MSQRQSTLDTFYRFGIGLYLFALVLAMYAGTDDPTIHVKDLLTSWAAGVLAGSFLLVAWITKRPLRRPVLFLELFLCFLGFFLVATLFSEFFQYSMLETGQFFSFFALYWLASQVYTRPEQVLRLFLVFCAGVFVAGLYAVLQKAGVDPFPWENRESDTYTNLPATFGNPNYAAHAIILALIMIVCLVRSGIRWAGWVFVPVLLFHLYSTGQRAGWIALAGAAVLAGMAFLLVRNSKRPVLASSATILLFALLGVGAVSGAMYLTQLRTGHVFPLDLSLLLRYQSYVSATNMLFDAPILGHGPAVYGLAYSQFWTPYEQAWFAQELRVNEHVHNDLLELAIDGGLAAAGLYLSMIIVGIGYGLMLVATGTSALQKRLGFAFAAFFTAFAIDGLFGFNLRVPVTAALFFIMMGVLDGLWSTNNQTEKTGGTPPALGAVLRMAFLVLLALATWQETRRFASEYYFYQGTQARAASNYDGAMAAFSEAESRANWSWEIPGYMGLLELDRNRPDLALGHFKTALERNPHAFLTHLPAARANLMLAQMATTREDAGPDAAAKLLEAARSEANSALLMAPGLPAANDILGRVESIAAILRRDQATEGNTPTQHWEKAREYFKAAIDGGSREPAELYRMLMRVNVALNDLDAAEKSLENALRSEPGDGQTWKTFLDFAREHQRFDGMRGVLYRTIERIQNNPAPPAEEQKQLAEAYAWLASVQEEGFGDVQATADALEGAVKWGAKRADVWNRFFTFAQKYDRLPEFYESLRGAHEAALARGETSLPQVEAVALALGDPVANLDAASRKLLGALVSQTGANPLPVLIQFAWAATALQSHYDQLNQAGSAPCESALNLGVIAAKLGGLEVATPMLERAAGCLEGENRGAAAVHWADAIARQGHPDQALEILGRFKGEFPDNLEIQWGIARAKAAIGQLDEARQIYRTLIENADLAAGIRGQMQKELEALK